MSAATKRAFILAFLSTTLPIIAAGAPALAQSESPQVSGLQVGGLQGDPERGRQVFGECRPCHDIGPRARHKSGPELNGLLGSVVGERNEYASSLPMIFAGLEGMSWTPETLDAFLTDPENFIPNNAMTLIGVPDAQDRADLIAYIATAGASE